MIRQFSAGGVVYKKFKDQTLYLLRRGTRSGGHYRSNVWGLPKGWLDDAGPNLPGPCTLGQKRASAEEVETAALREVREETGVEAKIIQRLGNVNIFFSDENHQKIFKTIIIFLMRYLSDDPAGFDFETSEIKWVDVKEAETLLETRKGEFDLILKASTLV